MDAVAEREINGLTPWSASTMANLCLAGVTFAMVRSPNVHSWTATWYEPNSDHQRRLVDHCLWKLVHQVALAKGNAREHARG